MAQRSDYSHRAARTVSILCAVCGLFPESGRALDKSPDDMRITVKIAAGDPSAIDTPAVASEFPYGTITVEPVAGGLDVPSDTGSDLMVIVNAAVLVNFDE
jgi:uncharacterized protein (TIGR02058 family)